MYMSYCRLEGTRQEMAACLADVEEHINEEAAYETSDREIHNFRRMVREFADFLQENDLLDDNGYINDEVLDEICEKMAKSYADEDEDC